MKTYEQVLQKKVDTQAETIKSLRNDLIAVMARVSIMGGNIEVKYQSEIRDLPKIHHAAAVFRKHYPDIPVPELPKSPREITDPVEAEAKVRRHYRYSRIGQVGANRPTQVYVFGMPGCKYLSKMIDTAEKASGVASAEAWIDAANNLPD